MNLIFVNSFVKIVEEDRTVNSQVSIAEQHGTWHILWIEEQVGVPSTLETWYEGKDWSEMLETFRIKLKEKSDEGFTPALGS